MSDDTAIVTVEAEYVSLGAIRTAGPMDVIRRASDVATELAKIVQAKKLYTTIQGRKFVQVEGWSTLGAMVGVLPREVPGSIIRYEDGSYEATVELIRTSDGAVIGRASALCGVDEKDRSGKSTWGSRPEYARRSMAVTRATGKAYRLGFSWIMTLAGYEPTPAEEMPEDLPPQPKTPAPTQKPPAPSAPPEPEPEITASPDTPAAVQAAMNYTTKSGKRLGTMGVSELNNLLDWCNAHADNEATKEPKAHIETLLQYMARFEQPADGEQEPLP